MSATNGRMTTGLLMGSVAAALLAGLGGCKMSSRDDSASANDAAVTQVAGEPINTICPIGGHAVPDNSRTVDYKGYTIVFCCDGCVEGWADEDEAGRDEILAIALAEKQGG